MKRRGLLRQGDVLLVPVESLPNPHRPLTNWRGRLVLAEGEATGHAHVVRGTRARLFAHRSPTFAPTRHYLFVERESATLVHEEHAPIRVPPGIYQVVRQREYEPRSWRTVAD
jgi:hypothetical protein